MDGLGHHPIPCYEQDFYGDAFIADPLPHYAAMRGLGPVVFLPTLGNYAITRYDEVRQVLRHFEVFSSAQGVAADQVGCDFLRGVHGNTLNSDPPRHDVMRAVVAAVRSAGGSIVGSTRNPIGAGDFSSYLLAASSSGANVIGLASVGGDTITAIKQAAKFGLGNGGQRLAGFLVFITDIHSLGLEVAQGLYVSSGFYWDQNDSSRAFSNRFMQKRPAMPTKSQAAPYAATMHWLNAVRATGTTDGLTVNRQMRAVPGDFFGKATTIRKDGRAAYDMDLYQVKSPSESKGSWNYYRSISTVAGVEAFRSFKAGGCQVES